MSNTVTKSIRVGPKLLALIEKQMQRIEKELHGIKDSSYYEAGEILAMKMMGEI